MNKNAVTTSRTTAPDSAWPTVQIHLARPDEPEDSRFVRIERHCPMARGQRCLILAQRHGSLPAFLSELCGRINSLNPGVEARLLQVHECDPAPDVDALIDAADSALRQGRHSVLILNSLNALAVRHAASVQACKRLFGTARATKGGGTTTVIAVAHEPAVTKCDSEVLREFKGTGNMELALCVDSSQDDIAVDLNRSGTKHAERIRSAE